MPFYEFKCPECGHTFEKIRKMSEASDPAECPECGKMAEKMVSGSNFRLNGGGWFKQGYVDYTKP